jgi:hypothetical protein
MLGEASPTAKPRARQLIMMAKNTKKAGSMPAF